MNYYKEIEYILERLEEIEYLKKNTYIPEIKMEEEEEQNKYIGNKYNMLTVLEKTDKRSKNR